MNASSTPGDEPVASTQASVYSLAELRQAQRTRITERRLRTLRQEEFAIHRAFEAERERLLAQLRSHDPAGARPCWDDGGEKKRHRTAQLLLEQAERQARIDAEARVRERQVELQFSEKRARRWLLGGLCVGTLVVAAVGFLATMRSAPVVQVAPHDGDVRRIEEVLSVLVKQQEDERARFRQELAVVIQRLSETTDTIHQLVERWRSRRERSSTH